MRKLAKLALAATILGIAGRQAWAVEAKVGGQIFASYTHTLSKHNAPLPTSLANQAAGADVEAKGRHSFDVSRVYLSADAKFDDHWKAKIVLEGNTTNAGNGVILKGAFLEYGDLYGVDLRGGLLPTLWTPLIESYWGRRYVQKVAADLWVGVPTWDKGVSAAYKLPMGYGKIQAMYSNGEALNAGSEATNSYQGRQKDAAVQLTIKPMPDMDLVKNIELHAYVHQGKFANTAAAATMDPNRDRNRLAGAVTYKDTWGHFAAEYFTAKTGQATAALGTARSKVLSVHGSYNMPWVEGTSVFARFDRADTGLPPGGVITSFPYRLWLGGVEKKFNDNVRMAADLQFIDGKLKQKPADIGSERTFITRYETLAGVHVEVKF